MKKKSHSVFNQIKEMFIKYWKILDTEYDKI